MPPSLFRSGIVPRIGAALGFAVAAFALVAVVDDEPVRRGPPADRPANEGAARAPLHLEIESVRPLASWRVLLDGTPLAPSASDARAWSTTVDAGPGVLLIETVPAEAGPPANAVRIRAEHGAARSVHTAWTDRDGAAVVRLDSASRDARPPP